MAEYVLSHIENVEYREEVRKSMKTRDPVDKHLFSQYRKIYSDEKNQPYVFGHKPNVNVKIEKIYEPFCYKSKIVHKCNESFYE